MTDIVLYNGHVYTMDVPNERFQAVAISGNRIAAVGTDGDILAMADAHTRVIDLKGKCVLPGFNDSHCHLVFLGMETQKVQLRGLRSVEACMEALRRYIADNAVPEGAWVVGTGYDQLLFDEPRQPNRRDLDAVSTAHPIMVERICGHIGAANTPALKLAGFDEVTRIEGGILEKDADGRLNGVLVETARDVLARKIPKPDVAGTEALIRAVFEQAAAFGVTSMQTDDTEAAPLEVVMAAARNLAKRGEATVRIWEEVEAARLPALRAFLDRGLRTGDGDPFFRIGNIKLICDGSLGARTACMQRPYADAPDTRGVAVYTQADLDAVVLEAHRAGMQVACHAIGDGAADMAVRAFEAARASDGVDLRNRVVHCQFADDALLDRMAAGGVCADIQPAFVVSDRDMVPGRMGARGDIGYRWAAMARRGIVMGGGSDSPVETINPIWGIHCAVNRADAEGMPAGGWMPGEKLTVEQAVRLYTADGAYLSFEEHEKGRLKPGMLADMAILDRDIFAVPPGEIHAIRNVMTVMDGRVVYDEKANR